MAINKYIINTSDSWGNLFAILQENATNFFDSIEIDNNDKITCKVGEDTALIIHSWSTNNGLYDFYTKNGNHQTIDGLTPTYVVITSKGIMIHSNVSQYTPTDLFICKTNNGDLAFVCLGNYYTGASYDRRFWSIDYENTPNIGAFVSNSDNALWSALSPFRGDSVKKTTFNPILCYQSESHLDGVYQLVANQYYNIYGIITDSDGYGYFTNGCLALAE